MSVNVYVNQLSTCNWYWFRNICSQINFFKDSQPQMIKWDDHLKNVMCIQNDIPKSLFHSYKPMKKSLTTPVFIVGFITHGHITVYKPDNSTVADSNNLVCYCFNQGYTSTLKDLQASQETFKEPLAHKNFEKITLQISAHSIVCVQLRLVSK